MLNTQMYQTLIRNAKEAVEKELGPLVADGQLQNLQYGTYLELIRGTFANMKKDVSITSKDDVSF